MVWWFVFAATGLLLAALHYYLTCTYRFWKERLIPCMKGAVPGLGNVYPVLLRKQNHNQLYKEFYSRMTGCSMAGVYDMRTPILMLRDPELVKTVLNPEKFDPERFSAECKQERSKFVSIPFGEGPRICVGMRMALMQVKAAAATLVRNYSHELSPRTQLPLQLDPNYFINSATGGLWVYVKPV